MVSGGKLIDAPLAIEVTGLRPRTRVWLRLSTRDSSGTTWTSRAEFVADQHGDIDPRRQSPIRGSYKGVQDEGLVSSMRPGPHAHDVMYIIPRSGERLKISESIGGQTVTTVSRSRSYLAPDVAVQTLRPAATGLYGDYFAPPASGRKRVSVILVGGSQGGLTTLLQAALLASHGYPSLALAYFGEPGLPTHLKDIPLEYFAHAARWVRRKASTPFQRVGIYGASRGSEAALLVAAHFPALVGPVVALAPSDVSVGAFPACNGAAWTLRGHELPYQCKPGPTADPQAATIDVAAIRSRLFLACGGYDVVWPACPMERRIARRHRNPGDVVLTFSRAGHGLDFPVPGVPISFDRLAGATPTANARARRIIWTRLLTFLAKNP